MTPAPPWSLSRRLVLQLTLMLTAVWLLAALGSALLVRHEIEETLDRGLRELAQRLLPLALGELDEEHEDEEGGRRISVAEAGEEDHEVVVYQLRRADGRVVLSSRDAPAAPLTDALRPGFATVGANRLYTEIGADGRFALQVAEPMSDRARDILRGMLVLLAPLALILPVAALIVAVSVRRATRPVHRVAAELAARSGANLKPVDAAGTPIELTPIVTGVNHLLDRLRRALEAERSFAADSAHELRTPIAAAMAQAQRLEAELARADLKARARGIADILKRLATVVEKLLQLARVEAGVALHRERTDLVPIVELLVEEQRRRSEVGARLRLETRCRTLPADLDVDSFGIALLNLVENALLHGAAGGPVAVTLHADCRITVVNTGPVVPPERLTTLRRRFERASSGTKGTGLGLAIADAILRQSGAELLLHSPARGLGDGFEAEIRWVEVA